MCKGKGLHTCVKSIISQHTSLQLGHAHAGIVFSTCWVNYLQMRLLGYNKSKIYSESQNYRFLEHFPKSLPNVCVIH